MPGIAGILVRSATGRESAQLDVMVKSVLHNSFYALGKLQMPELGVYIGYVCIKGSFSDCMPIYNEQKNRLLYLAGECFPDPSEITRLGAEGHRFDPDDASYLVHIFETEGPESVKRLNGGFAGIALT